MPQRRVRILLLGQTGVGKSTLINMFGNYFSEKPLNEILRKKCNILVPTKFTLQRDDEPDSIIEIGSSKFEIPGTSQSATQIPSIYSFNNFEHNILLDIIDTPGVGDTRGLEYDVANSEMILNFISEFPSIDAICILLKPDVTRLTPEFEVCIKQIFEQLDKSIIKNVVFLYTHGRMRNFKSADTETCLRVLFTDIQRTLKTKIAFSNENSFFVDNESFKYVVSCQRGLYFSGEEESIYKNSFNISKKNIDSLITYILNLESAPLQGVVCINESKRLIRRLTEPLIQLTISYIDAISDIEDYKTDLVDCENDINSLKKNMFKITHVPMETRNEVADTKDFNFSFDLSKIVNMVKTLSWKDFLNPFQFSTKFNKKSTKTIKMVEYKELDKEIIAEINDQKSAMQAIQKKLKEMRNLCTEYDEEINGILTSIATFISFVDGLKCIGGQDLFKDFMDTFIEQYNNEDRMQVVTQLKNYLRRYECIKKREGVDIKPIDVQNSYRVLIRAKHTGHAIKAIIDEKIDFEKIVFIG